MQTCIDKDGTMNTMCHPPSGLMLAQLKVETSKLLYPPLIPINGSMHLASDTNVIFDKVEKCLVKKLTIFLHATIFKKFATTQQATIFGFVILSRCCENCRERPALLNSVFKKHVKGQNFKKWLYEFFFIIR